MTRRPWAKRGVLLGAMAFIGACLVPIQFSPAQAADNGAWSAVPIRSGNQTPRQFFFYEVTEGQTIRDTVTIKNTGSEPQRLTVYPADAYNVEAGAGFALRPFNEDNTDMGTWIKVSKKEVTIDPGKKVNVPFTMTIPRGTSPGDHAGGVVTLEPTPTGSQGGTSEVLTQRAIGVRIYARVAGPLSPGLTVQSVQLQATPARLPFVGLQGGATVTYTVRNTGNVRITADRVITLKGLLGRTLHDTGRGPIPEILPGATVTLSETFAGMPVLDQVTARVELSEDQVDVRTAGDTQVWIVSIPFLVLLLILLAGTAFAIWWSRRGRTNGSADASAEPAVDRVDAGAVPGA